MENQQDHDLGNKTNISYLCRQSNTRWTPTSDQIRILKELYYNNGIRSPTADQIQRIASRLRHYGKIEGKNVFYWFQNHKARERQKKRFIPPPPQPSPSTTTILPSPVTDHHHHYHNMQPYFYNQQQLKLHAAHHMVSPPDGGSSSSSSSSQAFLHAGYSYGAITMDCSISPGVEYHDFGSWVGGDSCSMKPENETLEEDDDGGGKELSTKIETLPLFPIPCRSTTTAGGDSHHDMFKMEDSEDSSGGYYTGGNWFRSDGRTSLELSLNSYGYYD